MKKLDGFRIKKASKPELEKVSVKLLMTAKERILFDLYAEKSGIDKTAIATKAVNVFIRGDSYFKKVIERSPKMKEQIENAELLNKGDKKVKKVVKKVVKRKRVKRVKKPVGPTVIKSSGHNPTPFNPLG